MKRSLSLCLLAGALACSEAAPYDGLVFNEFEATVDYFELANAGGDRLDLGGLRIADDDDEGGPRLASAVTVPEGTRLGPGEILLVIANLDEAADGWQSECQGFAERCLHASFGISRDYGERLFVVDPEGEVVVHTSYPRRPVANGLSWGRLPDGVGAFGANRPTPGARNRPPWSADELARQRRDADAAGLPDAPVDRGPTDEDIARELLERSGLAEQFSAIQRSIESSVLEGGKTLAPAVRRTLARGGATAYSPARLRAAAEARLAADLDRARAEQVLEWLRSPLGRRIRELEEAASGEEAIAGIRALAASLQNQPADPQRLALARRIDTAAGSTLVSAEVLIERELAVATALEAADPAFGGANEARQEMARQRASLIRRIASSTLVSLLYTYRDLSMSDLEAYAGFLESPVGTWYAAASRNAVTGALAAARSNLRLDLGEALADFATEGADFEADPEAAQRARAPVSSSP